MAALGAVLLGCTEKASSLAGRGVILNETLVAWVSAGTLGEVAVSVQPVATALIVRSLNVASPALAVFGKVFGLTDKRPYYKPAEVPGHD